VAAIRRDHSGRASGGPLALPWNEVRKFSFGISLILAVQPHFEKYFRSRLTQIKSISLAVLPHTGAYRDRHGRGAGCGGRGSVGRANSAQTNGACCGRQSRVVLTPRRWRQVRGNFPRNDGGKKARSPGRARNKPLKPLRAGMPGESGATVVTTLVCYHHTLHTRLRVQRAPGIPHALCFPGRTVHAQLGRLAPRECGRASFVIARRRKRRSNPAFYSRRQWIASLRSQ
jgi:hypothetical protein